MEERETAFFADCAKLKPEEKEAKFALIKEEYKRAIEDASEKVQVAEDCYGLVDRYLRKLDEELHKFKMELEADHRGITELLEKQSLEMDAAASTTSHLKENRLPKKSVKKNNLGATKDKIILSDSLLPMDPSPSLAACAIAHAASQAIAATQQLTGRRTSSLKASFEAINLGMQGQDFNFGKDATASSSSSLNGAELEPQKKRPKISEQVLDVVSGDLLNDSLMGPGMGADLLSSELRDQDWNFDPNEPRYCICNQVSYGDMVACDNEDVSFLLNLGSTTNQILSSVLTNGFTTHAWVLKPLPKANGIALLVKPTWPGARDANKCSLFLLAKAVFMDHLLLSSGVAFSSLVAFHHVI